ncbi:MAG: flagellar hook capping FlgD N-terminal domain-containing protein [Pseudomonadota bacterium]
MDLVSFVSQTSSTGVNTESATANLAEDFDTFLTLLTAQLENQDPLDPVESAEFTDQLVQFSQVEQQIQTNESMEKLITSSQSSAGAALSGYLGQSAEINANAVGYSGAPITWKYALPSDAATATVSVINQDGQVVYSEDAQTSVGSHLFEWSGELFGDGSAQDGVYAVTVTAEDANAEPVETGVGVIATVTGVDLSYEDPAITTSAGIYAYSDILRLAAQ